MNFRKSLSICATTKHHTIINMFIALRVANVATQTSQKTSPSFWWWWRGACVVYTSHSSPWRMFVLETRIEKVSAAARREGWGKLEGQRKSKIQARNYSHFIDPSYINLCIKTSDYLKENFLFPVKPVSMKILLAINGRNLIICIWIQPCGAMLSWAAQCQRLKRGGWIMSACHRWHSRWICFAAHQL